MQYNAIMRAQDLRGRRAFAWYFASQSAK